MIGRYRNRMGKLKKTVKKISFLFILVSLLFFSFSGCQNAFSLENWDIFDQYCTEFSSVFRPLIMESINRDEMNSTRFFNFHFYSDGPLYSENSTWTRELLKDLEKDLESMVDLTSGEPDLKKEFIFLILAVSAQKQELYEQAKNYYMKIKAEPLKLYSDYQLQKISKKIPEDSDPDKKNSTGEQDKMPENKEEDEFEKKIDKMIGDIDKDYLALLTDSSYRSYWETLFASLSDTEGTSGQAAASKNEKETGDTGVFKGFEDKNGKVTDQFKSDARELITGIDSLLDQSEFSPSILSKLYFIKGLVLLSLNLREESIQSFDKSFAYGGFYYYALISYIFLERLANQQINFQNKGTPFFCPLSGIEKDLALYSDPLGKPEENAQDGKQINDPEEEGEGKIKIREFFDIHIYSSSDDFIRKNGINEFITGIATEYLFYDKEQVSILVNLAGLFIRLGFFRELADLFDILNRNGENQAYTEKILRNLYYFSGNTYLTTYYAQVYLQSLSKKVLHDTAQMPEGKVFGSIALIRSLAAEDLIFSFPHVYKELIDRYNPEGNFSYFDIISLIREESFFNPNAVSGSNAVGLMQLLPSTAYWIKTKKTKPPDGFSGELKKPEISIELGILYLDYLYENTRSKFLSIASYNAGLGTIKKYYGIDLFHSFIDIEKIKITETQLYLKKIARSYCLYRWIYELEPPGGSYSGILKEWGK